MTLRSRRALLLGLIALVGALGILMLQTGSMSAPRPVDSGESGRPDRDDAPTQGDVAPALAGSRSESQPAAPSSVCTWEVVVETGASDALSVELGSAAEGGPWAFHGLVATGTELRITAPCSHRQWMARLPGASGTERTGADYENAFATAQGSRVRLAMQKAQSELDVLVLDQDGRAVPGVKITLEGPPPMARFTDDAGHARWAALRSGHLSIKSASVEKRGFSMQGKSPLTVASDGAGVKRAHAVVRVTEVTAAFSLPLSRCGPVTFVLERQEEVGWRRYSGHGVMTTTDVRGQRLPRGALWPRGGQEIILLGDDYPAGTYRLTVIGCDPFLAEVTFKAVARQRVRLEAPSAVVLDDVEGVLEGPGRGVAEHVLVQTLRERRDSDERYADLWFNLPVGRDGRFRLPRLPGVDLVRFRNIAPTDEFAIVPAAHDLAGEGGLRVESAAPGALTGTVTNASIPMSELRVQVVILGVREGVFPAESDLRVSEAGTFRTRPHVPGRWIVIVSGASQELARREIEVQAGTTPHLSIDLGNAK